ncbi:MAG: SRPBCC domain-containing protein [Caulobacter sp.]|nr:SRPBCC domain-containing protein [Caulobacter sp.]
MASRVLVSVRVRATPDRAFEVFTREIALWWQPNPEFAFTPRSPGQMAFEDQARLVERLPSGKVFEVGQVTAWEPGRRLAFGWRQATFAPDQATDVEVTFEAVGEETRVTVTHTGWDSVPREHAAKHGMENSYFLKRHGDWWRRLLDRMGERV